MIYEHVHTHTRTLDRFKLISFRQMENECRKNKLQQLQYVEVFYLLRKRKASKQLHIHNVAIFFVAFSILSNVFSKKFCL